MQDAANNLVQRNDWVAKEPERLAAAFRKVATQALVRANARELQEFEVEFFKALAKRWLDAAEGIQLDRIGRLLDEPRTARLDADYRLALRVVIRARRSHGRVEDVYAILDLMGIDYRYDEGGVAAFRVEAYGAQALEAMRWIFYIRTAGVSAEVVTMPTTSELSYRYEYSGGPTLAGNVRGWSGNPALGRPRAHARRV